MLISLQDRFRLAGWVRIHPAHGDDTPPSAEDFYNHVNMFDADAKIGIVLSYGRPGATSAVLKPTCANGCAFTCNIWVILNTKAIMLTFA